MPDRPRIEVSTPPGGWGAPWPNVAEIETALPPWTWTLVGGLMTQLHAAFCGIDTVRPTDDVDIVLHVETTRDGPNTAARALESLGYTLLESIDPSEKSAHRFRRGRHAVDLVTTANDIVDVVIADHAAPRAVTKLRGRDMVAIEGGTQALQRTVNATMSIVEGRLTAFSTPSVFGALVLKAAAFRADSRDPQRHLLDAAVLLACLGDPYEVRGQFKGSDRSRLQMLGRHLPVGASEWRSLDADRARDGQAALRVLTAE